MKLLASRFPAAGASAARRAAPSALVWAGCVFALGLAWAGGGALPQRNLLVEVRQTDSGQGQLDDAGVRRGDVIINSNGQVSVSAKGGWEVRTQTHSSGTVQQLWVLNGSRASLRLGQAVPLQWWQVVSVPNYGSGASGAAGSTLQAVPSTVWTEAGRSIQVQPTWRGGNADVLVEVLAEDTQAQDPNLTVGVAGRMAATPPPASQTASVLTTVQVPLGTWVTIASTADEDRQRERGLLSSRDAQRSRQRLVQIRVTAPSP